MTSRTGRGGARLALAGVLLAGCAAGPAAPTPSISAAASATLAPGASLPLTSSSAPSPTRAPEPTLTPTQRPAPDCPVADVHVVVAGDTLASIAARYGVSLDALWAANPQIEDARLLRVGDRIMPPLMDLGTLGGIFSQASDVNEYGEVVGYSKTASSHDVHAFLWQDGTMTDLGRAEGLLQGLPVINDQGQVLWTDHGPAVHAFTWQDGTLTDLGTLGGMWAVATAINNRGQIVGRSQTGGGGWGAFLWQDGTMTDLGTLGGASAAGAINNRGQIVGTSTTPAGEQQAILWQEGTMTVLDTLDGVSGAALINDRGQVLVYASSSIGTSVTFLWEDGKTSDLATLDGGQLGPLSMNEFGDVVGYAHYGGEQHALLWRGGTVTDLGGGTWSIAFDINERRQIVGRASVRDAFLWQDGTMTLLGGLSRGKSGWASAVNDCGLIAGTGETASGEVHAFVTPTLGRGD